MTSFVRITVLLWADLLAGYALWVMVTYLTNVWKKIFTHASLVVNVFTGVAAIMPIGLAFFVDSFLGDYLMLLLSSLAYSVRLSFLAMSTPPFLSKAPGNCSAYKPDCIGDTQKVLFYIALALIAVGFSGHVTSLVSFLEFQKKTENDENFGQFGGAVSVLLVAIIGCIGLPYIKPWSIRFGIPAICTVVATLLFFSGSWSYKCDELQGSPLTTLFRFSAASASKIFNRHPRDANGQQEQNGRKLCTVTSIEVKETIITLRMIPMWMAFVMCGLVISIGNTYFVEQENHMNRKVGSLKVPLPLFLIFYNMAKSVFKRITAKKFAAERENNAPPIGFVTAMIFSTLCCITAAKVETRRLDVIKSHGLLDKPDDKIPMSIFWLLPRFVLLGGVDGISEHCITCLFKRWGPLSEGRYPGVFSCGVRGSGIMWSVLTVYIAGKVTGRGGKRSWFQDTLNRSRLDNYYWTLAVLSSINLVLFIFVAVWYAHQESKCEDGEAPRQREVESAEPYD